MRGLAHKPPFLGLFLFALMFLMLARRDISLVTSIFVAWVFSMGAVYALLTLREAEKHDVPYTTALNPKRWALVNRKQLQTASWVLGAVVCLLLGAGLLTGNI